MLTWVHLSTKTECDYLNSWIKKRSHTQKSHPKVVNPRDTAGEHTHKKKSSLVLPAFLPLLVSLKHILCQFNSCLSVWPSFVHWQGWNSSQALTTPMHPPTPIHMGTCVCARTHTHTHTYTHNYNCRLSVPFNFQISEKELVTCVLEHIILAFSSCTQCLLVVQSCWFMA